MLNRLNFEGYVEKIIFKNDQVIKFTVVNEKHAKAKKITATLFKSDGLVQVFDSVENLIGRLIIIVGEIYESSYKHKQTNEWINGYCIQVTKIIEQNTKTLEG